MNPPPSVAIAVYLSEERAFAVQWAIQNYLRPGDSVVLLHVRPTSVLYGPEWGSVDPNLPNDAVSSSEFISMTCNMTIILDICNLVVPSPVVLLIPRSTLPLLPLLYKKSIFFSIVGAGSATTSPVIFFTNTAIRIFKFDLAALKYSRGLAGLKILKKTITSYFIRPMAAHL
ncbi:Hypothetical predicted protein [Prunus dulcis]|uniref:Adenine nucleotide alpha hydrolases-like superfamily protein n=1 Tax=Prunus dulcis TaxID=3755 RepID=A0A5E4FG17_PRUDU|nr:Hypothetical predicted protein [Prunus dulcis]